MTIIYIATNLINGKQYIGKTSYTIEKRSYEHIRDSLGEYDKYLFHKAIRKYGEDAFEFETLDEVHDCIGGLTEMHYIKMFDTLMPNGYNMTTGGEGTKGFKKTPEQLENWYIANEYRFISPKCLETGIVYRTTGIAEKETGCNGAHIWACIRRQRRTVNGLHWVDAADINATIESIETERQLLFNEKCKPVQCIDTGEIFESLSAVKRELGINDNNVRLVCQGKRKTAGGFRWQFITSIIVGNDN